MKRFRNILYVAGPDGHAGRALRHAVSLAKSNEAALNVIGVIPPTSWEARRFARFLPEAELRQRSEQRERDALNKTTEEISAEGVRAKGVLRTGTPFVEIIREVLRGEHDLLIKAPTGAESPKRQALGSLDMHLVRKCPCPVWLIKSGRRRTFARILAAVNPDPEDKERNLVNSLIMDLATSLARTERSELYIANAWSAHGEAAFEALQHRVSEDQLRELMDDIGKLRTDMLDTLASQYNLEGIVSYRQVLKAHPENAIPALATRRGIDLVVMGSLEHTKQPGVLIGNTAEDILARLHCSVLTVKPSDFDTPVKVDAST